MLFPEIEHHYVRTFKRRLDALDSGELERVFQGLEAEGAAALNGEGFERGLHRFERLIDLRYAGANSELTLPFPRGDHAGASLRQAFSAMHERQYGYSSPDEAIETMNLRVIARASSGVARVPDLLSFDDEVPGAGGTRLVYFGPATGSLATPVCARSDLDDTWRNGPLLVEEFDSTTVVPPDGRARCVAWNTIEIELE
jgi:N-methylhydantoinase A